LTYDPRGQEKEKGTQMKYSVAEHLSQSNHTTWNFVCTCKECKGYFVKVAKTDVPALLKSHSLSGYLTVEEWHSLNHKVVVASKQKVSA
jgi:hypothetical protein